MQQAHPWLEAVAEELTLLADDIAGLGERLSDDMLAGRNAGDSLQHFDLLSQRAAAQAELLRALVTHGADPVTLIARIPFHDARQRVLAAVRGEVPPAVAAVTGMELF